MTNYMYGTDEYPTGIQPALTEIVFPSDDLPEPVFQAPVVEGLEAGREYELEQIEDHKCDEQSGFME